MTAYSAALFLHVMATLALVSALSLEAVIAWRRRADATVGEPLMLRGLIPVITFLSASSLAILFFSGGFMTHRRAEWVLAWPKVALAMLIAIGAMEGIAGRQLRNLRLTFKSSEAWDTLARRWKRSGSLMVLLKLKIALVVGAVLLMTWQPRWPGSLCVLGASFLFGLLSLFPIRRFRPLE